MYMKTPVEIIKRQLPKLVALLALPVVGVGGLLSTSCSDFFEQESDHIIMADDDHLNSPTDSIWSLAGILNKMQALTDRTVLLGEMRADLMDITDYTASDLRDVALFNVGDDNVYNQPRDYYAVINNCNYYIAKADTALKNNRNQYIFLREYAAIKAFRAWTYLQLALNYGQVPFVTEPILDKEGADNYEQAFLNGSAKKDIAGVCEYFINDLRGLEDVERPGLGTIRNTDSRLFYFPIYLLLGELNLWAGHYREAATCYYQYITHRNGMNSTYPVTTNSVFWDATSNWTSLYDSWSGNTFYSETFYSNGELITMLPMDSIPSEGNYSQLRNIFNSTFDNDFYVSAVPSQAMFALSSSQTYCAVNGRDTLIAPTSGLTNNRVGDLRLSRCYSSLSGTYSTSSSTRRVDNYQTIEKYSSRNVHLWRRTMVYAHMAEALNAAGFPRFAYALLSTGVNNKVLEEDIVPYYGADSTWLRQFSFPNTDYILATATGVSSENTMGLHGRGSGFTPANKSYWLDNPADSFPQRYSVLDVLGRHDHYIYPEETAERRAKQMERVDQLLLNELGLEFAFEGHRYYDLMRFALRKQQPSILADAVYGRRGEGEVEAMKAAIGKDLYNPRNWYLSWQGKIGY
jgi:hypothetical protein